MVLLFCGKIILDMRRIKPASKSDIFSLALKYSRQCLCGCQKAGACARQSVLWTSRFLNPRGIWTRLGIAQTLGVILDTLQVAIN